MPKTYIKVAHQTLLAEHIKEEGTSLTKLHEIYCTMPSKLWQGLTFLLNEDYATSDCKTIKKTEKGDKEAKKIRERNKEKNKIQRKK